MQQLSFGMDNYTLAHDLSELAEIVCKLSRVLIDVAMHEQQLDVSAYLHDIMDSSKIDMLTGLSDKAARDSEDVFNAASKYISARSGRT